MKNFYILFCTIFILGLILGYLTLPTKYDTGYLYFRSGLYNEAIEYFIEYLNKTESPTIEEIIPLTKSYFQQGKTIKAIQTLKKYIEKHPKSIKAREILGKFYLNTERTADYIENLREISKLEHSTKLYDILIADYSNAGNYKSMYKVLIDKYHYDASKLTQEEYYSLIYYYASIKSTDLMFKVIDDYLKTYKESVSINNIILIISIYYQLHKQGEAFLLADKLIKVQAVNPKNQIKLIDTISNLSPTSGLRLISMLPSKFKNNSKIILMELQNELSLNNTSKAYEKVNRLLKNKKVPPVLVPVIISVLLHENNYVQLNKLLHEIKINDLSVETLTNISINLLFRQHDSIAKYLLKNISENILNNDATLKLILESCTKEIPANEVAKQLIKNDYNLTDKNRFMITEQLFNTGYKKTAYDYIKDKNIEDILLNLSVNFIVDYAIDNSQAKEYLIKLKKINNEYNWKENKYIQCYLNILSAAGNKEQLEASIQKLEKNKNIETFLLSSYFTAEQFKHKKTGLLISEQMYKLNKKSTTLKYYINSLIENKQYTKAIELIISSGEKNYYTEFLSAYYGLLKNKNIVDIKKYKPQLVELYNNSINKHISDKELANLGYVLAEADLKDLAKEVFFKLSYNAPPESPYVKELIFLWGKSHWKKGVKWLTMRTKNASKTEQAKWFKYLNETGNPKEVISIFENEYK